MPHHYIHTLVLLVLSGAVIGQCAETSAVGMGNPRSLLRDCNVVWTSPSENASGSMPLGNGDIGINVWAEEGGDLLFYIGMTDAWSENGRLLKVGRIRVSLTPNPFEKDTLFRQELSLEEGTVRIRAGEEQQQTSFRIWVDAHNPVVRLEVEAQQPLKIRARLVPWRTEKRVLEGRELSSAYGLIGSPTPVTVSPDTVLPAKNNRLTWYHRNNSSMWAANLKLQGLEEFIPHSDDPLLGLTFGGAMLGEGLTARDSYTLESNEPSRSFRLSVCLLNVQTETAQQWLERLDHVIAEVQSVKWDDAWEAHCQWWKAFWDRSWIHVTADDQKARAVSRAYNRWRYVLACAGRGGAPIKFNGLIFNVDKPGAYDADYRNWGGAYWFQNTRLMYWPLLASGDFDLMRPLFAMYQRALPLAQYRNRRYFDHDGAYFPETMHFWGAYVGDNYGWDRTGKSISEIENPYIKWHFNGNLELLAMMLDHYEMTEDRRFFRGTVRPMAREFLTWFDEHWGRDEQGTLRMFPSQALEDVRRVSNPAPDAAGLHWNLNRLLSLPADLIPPNDRARWERFQKELPPLPVGERNGCKTLLAAEATLQQSRESPELYSIFPFRIYGVGKPELPLALDTFTHRMKRPNRNWNQQAIHTAYLGLTDQAREYVVGRLSGRREQRFPVFWGPYDWVPDGNHASVLMLALQKMLLQENGDQVLLFPAWPEDWDVDFKLHAPRRTTVRGEYRNGQLHHCVVTPPPRADDLIIKQ